MTHRVESSPLPWRRRVASGVALLVALALLALTFAHWGWRWLGPAPVSIPIAAPESDLARRIADARLFGAATPAQPNAAPLGPTGVGDLRLLGVFAQRDGEGYALFRAGTRGPLFVSAGQNVAEGVRLESVHPDGVTLFDGASRRDMLLRSGVPVEKPRAIAAATNARSSACAAPAGFTGPVVRLNAELLGGMIGAPDAWKALLEAGSGALIVRDQSGFAGMLGLKNGDRVESANGIALAIPDDIASTVLQPLTKSQPVWVAGSRAGKPQQWLYLNAGACPG